MNTPYVEVLPSLAIMRSNDVIGDAGVPFIMRTINCGKHGWGFVVSVRWILCGML